MNHKITTSTLACVIACTLFSCQKSDKNTDIDNSTAYQNVIIGCKSGSTIHVAIDPISADQFSFNPDVAPSTVVGPSALNASKTLYYCVGGDKMIDEVDINSGSVQRSFSMSLFPCIMHYTSNNNALLCVAPIRFSNAFRISQISLSTGTESTLFDFTPPYGLSIRTSFMRNGNLYFISGLSELMEVNMKTETISKVAQLQGVTNSLVYDQSEDVVYYLRSETDRSFSLYSYDFSFDVKLKNYPMIKGIASGSATFDEVSKIMYVYTSNSERADISVSTLDIELKQVSYALVNTEMVTCKVKQTSIAD